MTATKQCNPTDVIADSGVDSIFSAEVAMLRAAGCWAEASQYNAYGNKHSSISFVPTTGQQPEPVFSGQRSYGNVWRLEIRLYQGERILMTVSNHVARNDAPQAWLEPTRLSPQVVRAWVLDFLAHARKYA